MPETGIRPDPMEETPAMDVRKTLAETFPFFDKLTPAQQDDLVAATNVKTAAAGTIVHGGSECSGIIVVLSGQLRAYMSSEDGREITLYRMDAGKVCILSAACVLDQIDFDVTVEAVTASEYLNILPGVYNRIASENIYMECYGYQQATERFSDVMWAMQQILFMSFDRRLAVFLLGERKKTGSDDIRLTQEQIAKYMGSAREVVSRMLKYFVSEGLVRLHRGGVTILDSDALMMVAGPSLR